MAPYGPRAGLAVADGDVPGVAADALADAPACCAAAEAGLTGVRRGGFGPLSAPEPAHASSASTPSPARSAKTRRRQYFSG
ncbi:MAG TPA: hypothetical protein VKD26_13020 [Streptosporangiaceae bacterium]|nr:hypothetical protein [Streptosporangiaceae bacterium]